MMGMMIRAKKRLSLLFFILFSITFIQAQDRQQIAIIPLNPIGISKAEANTLSVFLETGLVNTQIFDVIEQTQVTEILEAQEYSLSDCTDEQCAVEFGKLLAAE